MTPPDAETLHAGEFKPAPKKIVSNLANPSYRLSKPIFVMGLLVIVLIGVALTSLATGPVTITANQVLAILADQAGIGMPWPGHSTEFSPTQAAVINTIRGPRIALGILIGGALAICGAAMQGLFRNPLADPALIGVASGAALGAVTVIVFGATLSAFVGFLPPRLMLPLAAFTGGGLATVLVYRIATRHGQTDAAAMLLAGIAVNAAAGAGTGLLTFMADDAQLRSLTFWMLGSLGGASWAELAAGAPFIVIPLLLIPRYSRALNANLLGENEAKQLGYDLDRIKAILIALVALAVGASVSMSGVIGFVGLVIPHLVRLVLGPDHRHLLPASALCGALLLLSADLIARTVVAPTELPIGTLTALLGGPFFLALLLRQRSNQELL